MGYYARRNLINMWTPGNQIIANEKDFNYEIESITGELPELEAKISLIKFLKENIGFTINLISGVDLLPLQEILVKAILKRDNSLIVATRGGGKSFIIAILAFLYPIFNFNSKMCLISANFRGSRRILEELEKIVESKKAKLLSQCFERGVKSRDIIRRAPDMYKINLLNSSEVFALPLTEGLRGVRASYVVMDEGLMLTKDIQNDIIRPFLNARLNMTEEMEIRKIENEMIRLGSITEKDRITFPRNKLSIFSTASYQFQYLYELYQEMIKNIEYPQPLNDEGEKPPTNLVVRLSYECIPKKTVIDTTQIELAKANGAENNDFFKREYRSIFTDSSGSYFNVKKLYDCTHLPGTFPTNQIFGDKDSEYLLIQDPSYSSSKESDYFGMGVYLLNKEERKITLVHTFGRSAPGNDLKEVHEYFAYLLLFFNIVMMAIDESGSEFINGFNESITAKEKNLKVEFIKDINFDTDDLTEYNKSLTSLKKQYNLLGRRFVIGQKFSTGNNAIRRMNEHLQNQINAGKVWFASPIRANTAAFNKYSSFTLPIKAKDNKDKVLNIGDFIDEQDSWPAEVRNQVALIEAKASSSGVLQYDMPQSIKRLKSENRPRKDHYTCLLMGNWISKIYFDFLFQPVQVKTTGFIPRFIN